VASSCEQTRLAGSWLHPWLIDTEDGGNTLCRNISELLPRYTVHIPDGGNFNGNDLKEGGIL
jgi:hypothetical protein